jgi:hypothetical protein
MGGLADVCNTECVNTAASVLLLSPHRGACHNSSELASDLALRIGLVDLQRAEQHEVSPLPAPSQVPAHLPQARNLRLTLISTPVWVFLLELGVRLLRGEKDRASEVRLRGRR